MEGTFGLGAALVMIGYQNLRIQIAFKTQTHSPETVASILLNLLRRCYLCRRLPKQPKDCTLRAGHTPRASTRRPVQICPD